ncbi:MAG: hypothetical protein KGI08_10855 [Thaumarchaeota archaeon]|nr:hypothetical protein [Nitrososphaerota archaeon]
MKKNFEVDETGYIKFPDTLRNKRLSNKKRIELSIEKFEVLKEYTKKNKSQPEWDGSSSCPLCWKYNWMENDNASIGCTGCPIEKKTGKSGCIDTPYENQILLAYDWKEYVKAFESEIKFLKSLL